MAFAITLTHSGSRAAVEDKRRAEGKTMCWDMVARDGIEGHCAHLQISLTGVYLDPAA